MCYADTHAGFATNHEDLACHTGNKEDEPLTTAEAVQKGMIDGGATQTIGSVAAVEAVMRQNKARHGHSGLAGVNAKDPPVFSFGNSTENRCLSTARLQVVANGKRGETQIHTLEW